MHTHPPSLEHVRPHAHIADTVAVILKNTRPLDWHGKWGEHLREALRLSLTKDVSYVLQITSPDKTHRVFLQLSLFHSLFLSRSLSVSLALSFFPSLASSLLLACAHVLTIHISLCLSLSLLFTRALFFCLALSHSLSFSPALTCAQAPFPIHARTCSNYYTPHTAHAHPCSHTLCTRAPIHSCHCTSSDRWVRGFVSANHTCHDPFIRVIRHPHVS